MKMLMTRDPYRPPEAERASSRPADVATRLPVVMLSLALLTGFLLCWLPVHPLNPVAQMLEERIEQLLPDSLSHFEEFVGPLVLISVAAPVSLLMALAILSCRKLLQHRQR